jgi:hypothetical protein
MKAIFAIILIAVTISASAQYENDPYYKHKGDPAKILLTYAGSIALNAVGNALDQKGQKDWGHACNAASIGILLTSPFYINYDRKQWYKYLLSYTFLRIALFDPIHNLTSGQPLTYSGGDNWWDRGVSYIDPAGMTFARGCAFIVGVSIPINDLGWRMPFIKQ